MRIVNTFLQIIYEFISMSVLEHSVHALRRRTVSPHYIPANLALFQTEMHDVILEAVQVCIFFNIFFF